MGAFREFGKKKVPVGILLVVLLVIGGIAIASYGTVKVIDKNAEKEFKACLDKLSSYVDIEGEVEHNKPKITREEVHQLMGREPDVVGTFGDRLKDDYHWNGPLTEYRISIRYAKNKERKWVMNNAKTYWLPGKMVRPHRDVL